MNVQYTPVDATRSMLSAVWEAVGRFDDASFGFKIPAGNAAPMLRSMGIRTLPSATSPNADTTLPIPGALRWRKISAQVGLAQLRTAFSGIRVVPFSDWASVHQAADLWSGLLADVIRPLARNDWEFIFYLGNPENRHFFDVDEILDVISSFSRTGRVTLALDEQEASGAWSILFGAKSATAFGFRHPEAKARYRAIYQTLDIARLIVYAQDRALMILPDTHFEITRPSVPDTGSGRDERGEFIEGYAIGLEAGLEPPLCLALGIATEGAVSTGSNRPTPSQVRDFLARWLESI
nr:hypothetical protein [uncultured Dyadobacter sp.]